VIRMMGDRNKKMGRWGNKEMGRQMAIDRGSR
jgi:hypothetical protein